MFQYALNLYAFDFGNYSYSVVVFFINFKLYVVNFFIHGNYLVVVVVSSHTGSVGLQCETNWIFGVISLTIS